MKMIPEGNNQKLDMTKADFLGELNDIIRNEILITDDVQYLEEEISTNCWHISTNQEIIDQLEVEDLVGVLQMIRENRKTQLEQSELESDLLYYSWFDEQACQLRFNLINANHKQLPFGATISLVPSEKEIIQQFLNSSHHDGIPWSELKDIPTKRTASQAEERECIKVYQKTIRKWEIKS